MTKVYSNFLTDGRQRPDLQTSQDKGAFVKNIFFRYVFKNIF